MLTFTFSLIYFEVKILVTLKFHGKQIIVCRCVGVPCRMVTIYNYSPRIENNSFIKLDIVDDIIAEKCKDTVSIHSNDHDDVISC